MTLPEATLLAFTAFSGLRLVSYLPQIYKVARDPNGASAISYSTWTLWTASNIATGLYAAINLGDPLLAIASALYALCCVTVIVITAGKRYGALQRGVGGLVTLERKRPQAASTTSADACVTVR
jgi:hypothetical protein